MAIEGFGCAFVIVSTFARSQGAALKHGFNDDINTYLLISGIYTYSVCHMYGQFILSKQYCPKTVTELSSITKKRYKTLY